MRFFTLEEATALLPRLAEMIQASQDLRDEAAVKKAQIDRLWQRLEGGEPLLSALGEEQRKFDTITEELVSIVQETEAMGCILRDLDTGLIDFPFRASGSVTVYLCWRRGEPAIAFWHGIGEGYAGRKPIVRLPRDST